ncbi:MAG: aminotransferase class I/II-fold pyridoxal phosphate-dependent enzyme [Clostridia bacterium]|nr:aminotransferase class I/II-fold pyridoxal phosphate-dependent enzyme [Clostridia bacterium]
MISFENDYSTGAHEKVLKRLMDTNRIPKTGYGCDDFCDLAKMKIKAVCKNPDAEIYFLVGGTQTNQVVIDTMCAPYEGVIAAKTGHINAHEAGAVEFCGHKVLPCGHKDGKISAEDVEKYVDDFYSESSYEHMVFPGMVYVSHPTEYGTLYTKKELSDLYEVCQKHNMRFFIDGARLAYGLCAEKTDVKIEDLGSLCDVFYIGGTKCGAFCGEAVVFTHSNMPAHFNTRVKQHGAMLAKGRFLGLQFDALFTNDLYFEIGRHAIAMAKRLHSAFSSHGYEFYIDSPTNQQFVIMDNEKMRSLSEKAAFSVWEKYDDTHTVVRFVTSWSTSDDDIAELEKLL